MTSILMRSNLMKWILMRWILMRSILIKSILMNSNWQNYMKNQVDSLMEGHEIPGYQLNHNTYVIKAAVSPQCPLGFVHVYVIDMGKIECALRYIFWIFVQYLYRVCIKVHLLNIRTVSIQYFSIFLNVAVSSIFVIFDVLDTLRDVGIDSLMANPTETHRYIGVSRVY